jgi:hypothetical protein
MALKPPKKKNSRLRAVRDDDAGANLNASDEKNLNFKVTVAFWQEWKNEGTRRNMSVKSVLEEAWRLYKAHHKI